MPLSPRWSHCLLLCSMALLPLAHGDGAPAPREQASVYAHIAWPNPLNPDYVPLGQDQFLLFTRQGMRRWDVPTHTFSTVPSWPAHHALKEIWAPLGAGRLVVGRSHDAQDQSTDVVVWWDTQQQAFSLPLPQAQNVRIHALVPLDAQHALVCQQPPTAYGSTQPAHRAAKVLALNHRQLHWVSTPTEALRQRLQAHGVRGQIEDWGSLPNTPTHHPVYFDADACAWKLTHPPNAMRNLPELRIQHHRLPDGRVLVSQAEWNRQNDSTHPTLGPPMVWDATAQHWTPIELTGESASAPRHLHALGLDDLPVRTHKTFIEFLDPQSLRWVRSRQNFPESPWPRVAPLANGQALVLGFDNGEVYKLDQQTKPDRGHLLSAHGRFGVVRQHHGGVLLAGAGQQWSPSNRVQRIDTSQRQAHSAAPMHWPIAYLSGLELADRSVLYFGGAPTGCAPSSWGEPCSQQEAMPSFRYFPAQDRWETVPDLRIHFAHGWHWDTGNSDVVSQWPRHDVLRRRNGNVWYLEAGNPWQRPPEGQAPAPVRLMRWHAGGPPQEVLPLPQHRTQATLLELPATAQGRLVAVVGGQSNHTTPLRSTLLLDERTQRWRSGPPAHYPGGMAVQLHNGRIFKLSLKTQFADSGYQAEIADRRLRRWSRLPPLPLPPTGVGNFRITNMVAAGNRVYLFTNVFDRRSLIWDDVRQRWQVSGPWPQRELAPDYVLPLTPQRLLVRSQERFHVVPYPQAR
ncbi:MULTISPECIES: Kelch repeat-containing protein [Giesbergeria]|uniref:Uncharacterized protein n=1 Tax=Giesbergeria sinuosa TaxID=80883 RepID=A0ABV9QAE9_9BURK